MALSGNGDGSTNKAKFVEKFLKPLLQEAMPQVKNCILIEDSLTERVLITTTSDSLYELDVTGKRLIDLAYDAVKVVAVKLN